MVSGCECPAVVRAWMGALPYVRNNVRLRLVAILPPRSILHVVIAELVARLIPAAHTVPAVRLQMASRLRWMLRVG
jgi:hypothetical protein